MVPACAGFDTTDDDGDDDNYGDDDDYDYGEEDDYGDVNYVSHLLVGDQFPILVGGWLVAMVEIHALAQADAISLKNLIKACVSIWLLFSGLAPHKSDTCSVLC